jgi:hypothetical protein
VKKLGAGAKNNTECWSFSYGIWSFPTVFSSYGTNPTVFTVEFVVSLIKTVFLCWLEFIKGLKITSAKS